MKKIALVGSSGHASVVLDVLVAQDKYSIAGYIDPYIPKGEIIRGYKNLGSYKNIVDILHNNELRGLIVAIGDNYTRYKVVREISELSPSIEFISAVHPDAVVSETAQLGLGSVIMAGVVVNPNVSVGSHCILNTNSSIDHDSTMGNYSSIAPNVAIAGNVAIGEYGFVGIGASVSNGVTIGANTVIGAGSTVLSNIGSCCLVYGTPARVVRQRSNDEKYL